MRNGIRRFSLIIALPQMKIVIPNAGQENIFLRESSGERWAVAGIRCVSLALCHLRLMSITAWLRKKHEDDETRRVIDGDLGTQLLTHVTYEWTFVLARGRQPGRSQDGGMRKIRSFVINASTNHVCLLHT